MEKIIIVVACDKEFNIGRNGQLPWKKDKEDMKFFRQITCSGKNPGVVMGRKTWESIPKRPLPLRHNIIMSRNVGTTTKEDYVYFTKDIQDVMNVVTSQKIDMLYVIGGADIYKCWYPNVSHMYITRIDDVFEGCDTSIPYDDMTSNATLENIFNDRIESWKTKDTWCSRPPP